MRPRKLLRRWSRHQLYRAAVGGRRAGVTQIAERLKATYRPVTCPLVLISQAERSGGTLLAQLFDGHSRILAHPPELHIGYPNKQDWPALNLKGSIDEQFRVLFETRVIERCETGYTKAKHATARNFFLLPQVQRELFREMMGTVEHAPRNVLNAYFTSYFNAWLNLRRGIDGAKFVTAFTPMLAADEQNMTQFWSAYPDGYLISIIRSPLNWYPSFVTLKSSQKVASRIETTMGRWTDMVEAVFREKQRRPDQVLVISFNDLLMKPEATMRAICARIGLDFEDVLTIPTFNGDPVEANTTFDPLKPGQVSSAPAEREAFISADNSEYIVQRCMPLYDRVIRELAEAVPS